MLETKTGRGVVVRERLKDLLKQTLALWRERRAGPAGGRTTPSELRRLKWSMTDHLRDRALTDPDNQRLLNELGRCHDAGSLVRFLDEPGIEPTNNRAERALRPAVIARKVSQCTKTAKGTHAFEAWTSVVRTLSQTKPDPTSSTPSSASPIPPNPGTPEPPARALRASNKTQRIAHSHRS